MSSRFNPQQTQSIYLKLPPKSRRIRLVTILPGSPSQLLECELCEARLDEDTDSYKALSYTWVDRTDCPNVPITCNGTTIQISSNLALALARLRSDKIATTLWIDSLCINQKDAAERTHQVGMMREIYQNSSEVIIWLGESGPYDVMGEYLESFFQQHCDKDTRSLFEWFGDQRDLPKLEAYYSPFAAKKRDARFSETARDVFGAFITLYLLASGVPASGIQHLRSFKDASPILRGFSALVEKAWWRRVWVVQEVVVAKKATVHFGKLSAPWKVFSDAAVQFERSYRATNIDSMYPYLTEGQPLFQFSRWILDIETTRREWESVAPTVLLPLIRKFRSRQAKDSRDKVYALLGLVRFWGGGKPISPNYSQAITTTFFQTSKMLISSIQSLSVLAGTLRQDDSEGIKGPSWITDWRCIPEDDEHVRLETMSLYRAGLGIRGSVRLHGKRMLECPAYHVDKVEVVGEEMTSGAASRMRLIVSNWEMLSHATKLAPYVAGGSRLDAFWRTICGDMEYLAKGPPTSNRGSGKIQFCRTTPGAVFSWTQWRDVDRTSHRTTSIIGNYWQESLQDETEAQDRNAFQHTLECASRGRKFFITESGYFGMGPKYTRPGDEVFLLCGTEVPFILREEQDPVSCMREPLETLFTNTERTYVPVHRHATLKEHTSICNRFHRFNHSIVGDAYVHGIMDRQVMLDRQDPTQRSLTTVYLV